MKHNAILACCASVNACVNLRRDNFDHPFVLCILLVTYLQCPRFRLCCHAPHRCTPPTLRRGASPRPPPAGRLHLGTLWWTACAETSEREIYLRAYHARSFRLPSLPQASRSYDPPPPLASTRSLLMPTEQGLSPPGPQGS